MPESMQSQCQDQCKHQWLNYNFTVKYTQSNTRPDAIKHTTTQSNIIKHTTRCDKNHENIIDECSYDLNVFQHRIFMQ